MEGEEGGRGWAGGALEREEGGAGLDARCREDSADGVWGFGVVLFGILVGWGEGECACFALVYHAGLNGFVSLLDIAWLDVGSCSLLSACMISGITFACFLSHHSTWPC